MRDGGITMNAAVPSSLPRINAELQQQHDKFIKELVDKFNRRLMAGRFFWGSPIFAVV